MIGKTPYEQLAASVGLGESKLIPAIFESLADENEARVLLAARPPATVFELSEKTGLGTSQIEEMIDPLFKKGLLYKSSKPGRYYAVRNWMQFHDATGVMADPPQKMLDLWKEWTATEFVDVNLQMETSLPGAFIRVIPVNVSVDFNNEILAFEDVKELIKEARSIAVTRCSCRAIDGKCGKSLEVCMQFDKAADYHLDRGSGRKITQDEALDMLRLCEEDGLVHIAGNMRSVGQVICNCCSDCCLNWVALRSGLGDGTVVAPSRFRATIEADECTGCEVCLDRCYFEAMQMDEETRLAVVNAEHCLGCGLCQVVCPTDAILMQEVRPPAFVPETGLW